MQLYFYDWANKIESVFTKPTPDHISRSEKQALRYMGATNYRVADPVLDKSLVEDTRTVCRLYNMPDMGKIIIYENKYPNASYMRESSTMLISTTLLEKLNQQERLGVIGHEIAHRNQRGLIQVATMGIIIMSVVAASFLTSKFKNNIAEFLRNKVSTKEETSRLRTGVEKLATAVERAPWAVSLAYGLIGLGVKWLVEIPQAAISRYFEWDADKQSAEKLKNPQALASALEKIDNSVKEMRQNPKQIPATEEALKNTPVPIPAPEPEPSAFQKYISEIKRSHPPVDARMRVLREMAAKQQAESAGANRA